MNGVAGALGGVTIRGFSVEFPVVNAGAVGFNGAGIKNSLVEGTEK